MTGLLARRATLATLATIAVLLVYEVVLNAANRRRPERMARSAHAALRADWFTAVSLHKGSEILAVQTLRNSPMSATMTASTAMLGLIGTGTLAAPLLHASLGQAAMLPDITPRLVLELLLLALLFASLVCSAMAVRYYKHLGFISGMPVESEARKRWANAGTACVRRAGVLCSRGLRHLILVAPVLACCCTPWRGRSRRCSWSSCWCASTGSAPLVRQTRHLHDALELLGGGLGAERCPLGAGP